MYSHIAVKPASVSVESIERFAIYFIGTFGRSDGVILTGAYNWVTSNILHKHPHLQRNVCRSKVDCSTSKV